MGELVLEFDKLNKKIGSLHEDVAGKKWEAHSVASFVHALRNCIPELEGINAGLRSIKDELEKDPRPEQPDLMPCVEEMNSLNLVLKRNLKMEEEKLQRIKEGKIDLKHELEVPQLYNELEQKILIQLLKINQLLERTQLHAFKKEGAVADTTRIRSNLLELLEAKEDELQELRKKYDSLRSKSFFGKIIDSSSADIEKELQELSRKMEAQQTLLEKNHLLQSKHAVDLEESHRHTTESLKTAQELAGQHLTRADELIALLKKERDYARKVLLEMEHESMQLRNKYSRELMRLEESKALARKEAEQRFERKISTLEKKLEEKANQLQELENKLKKLKPKKK